MIPLASTTVTVSRSDQDGTVDSYDTVTYTPRPQHVRAVIGRPGGGETTTGGSSEQATATLDCDPCDLRHDDRVTDDTTGDVWEVTWVRRRVGFGLDHMVAGLIAVTDRAVV